MWTWTLEWMIMAGIISVTALTCLGFIIAVYSASSSQPKHELSGRLSQRKLFRYGLSLVREGRRRYTTHAY